LAPITRSGVIGWWTLRRRWRRAFLILVAGVFFALFF
jgi:hypothetical protein